MTFSSCAGKPRGMRTARKLRNRRRVQKWADKQYKKAHLGTRWKANPFGGSSHAKGIVVEKLGIEAKQVGATPVSNVDGRLPNITVVGACVLSGCSPTPPFVSASVSN